jgi:hypothetical protein
MQLISAYYYSNQSITYFKNNISVRHRGLRVEVLQQDFDVSRSFAPVPMRRVPSRAYNW